MTTVLTIWLIGAAIVMQACMQRGAIRQMGIFRALQAAATWPIWVPVSFVLGVIGTMRK